MTIMSNNPPATAPAMIYFVILDLSSFSVGFVGATVDVGVVVNASAKRVCTLEMLALMAFEMSAKDPSTMDTRMSFFMASLLDVPGGNCK